MPPSRGKRDASSPKVSAPLMVRVPTPIQTSNNQKGDPRDFAIPAGVRKIPTAMHSPATAAVADARPNCRTRVPLLNEPIEIVLFRTGAFIATTTAKPAEYSNALDRDNNTKIVDAPLRAFTLRESKPSVSSRS